MSTRRMCTPAVFYRVFPFAALLASIACGEDPAPPPATDKLEITTSSLPAGRVAVAYDASISARGGDTSRYEWTIEDGALPEGLTLAASGASPKLSGTPATDGNFSFTVQVEDAKGSRVSKSFTLRIEPEESDPLIITTAALDNGVAEQLYDAQLRASGGSAAGYVWSIAGGALPVGLTLETSGTPSSRISGTPGQPGSYEFIVRVTDSDGATAERSYTVQIDAAPVPLSITTLNLPSGPIGTPYQETLEAIGGSGSGFNWALVQGDLPEGLTLAASGVISGTPTATTTADFTVRVTDSAGATSERPLSITITSVGLKLAILTIELPDGRVNEAYDQMLRASGGSSSGFTWSISQGSLPPGLTLEAMGTPSTTLSGTPTAAGDFTFTVEVRDSVGQRGRIELSIHVDEAFVPVHIVTTLVPPGMVNEMYQATLTAADGVGVSYNWLVTEGALPPGLVLDMSGTPSTMITGFPTRSGTFTATVTVFDTNNDTDTQSFTFVIAGPQVAVSIVTTTLSNAGLGVPYSETITATAGSASGYTWSISQGSLPPGLALDQNGTPSTQLSGTPNTPGEYNFTVRVEDSSGGIDTQSFTVSVGNALMIEQATLPAPILNRTYTATLTGSGGSGAGFNWSITQGSLPAGLTFNNPGTVATISGTPTTVGSRTFEIELRDSNNTVVRQMYTLNVRGLQRYIAWVGDTAVDAEVSVFLVDLTTPLPGSPVQVSPTTGDVPTSASLTQFSPDNTKIAFRGNFLSSTTQELFMVDLSGPSPLTAVRVSGPMVASGNVGSFAWSPDSRLLTYQADQETDAVLDQWVVDVSGSVPGTPIKISGTMVNGGDVGIDDFGFSPDSSRIYYVADQETNDSFYLYVADLASTPIAAARVNLPLVSSAADVVAAGITFTADSSRIIYVADQETLDTDELFMADVSGPTPGTPIKLNSTLQPTGDVAGSDTVLSPDGSWLAYIADANVEAVSELFVIDLRGATPGPAVLRSGPMVTGGDAQLVSWSPDSTRLLYLADQEDDGLNEIYVFGVGGALPLATTKVNAPIPTTGLVVANISNGFIWSPDSSWIAYRADVQADGAIDLFVVPMGSAGPGTASLLNGVLPTDGDISSMYFSPDSQRIAARGDALVNNRTDLYLSELSSGTPGPLVNLATPNIAAGNVDAEVYWFSNSRLAFFADYDVDSVFNAYMVDIAQPNNPLILHPPVPTGGDVSTLFSQLP